MALAATDQRFPVHRIYCVGRDVQPRRALEHVFGYAAGIDLTRRDLQRAAKPHGRIWLSVNGELRQEADVKQMLWDVPHIIAEPSTFYQLRPGDLIFCGTPAGVSPVKPGDQREGGVGGGSRCCASASQPPGVPAD